MTTLRFILALTTTLMVLSGCGSPGSSTTRRFDSLVIRGTPRFDEQVGQALALLKTKSPAAYARATNQVGITREPTPNSAGVSRSELDLDGLAGGLQRLEVELDADGDFLINQTLGYSP